MRMSGELERTEKAIGIIDSEYPIAMTYVPWQRWGETYDAEKALCRGTLFPALDLPFTGCDCERGANRG